MVGQGRPVALRWRYVDLDQSSLLRVFIALMLVLPLFAASVRGQEPTTDIRLRIAWGGSDARLWSGSISIDRGAFPTWSALGIEADEPASIWQASDRRIEVSATSARSYDGVDLSTEAPLDATLTIDLQAEDATSNRAPITLTVRQILAGSFSEPLDDRGNQIYVRRSPGDALRVVLDRSGVIRPAGGEVEFQILPQHVSASEGEFVRFDCKLHNATTNTVVWSESTELQSPPGTEPWEPIEMRVPIGLAEGVYDLQISAYPRGLRVRWRRAQPIAERSVQFVVLAAQPTAPAIDPKNWQVVAEIDPTATRWLSRIANLAPLPGLRRGSFGTGETRTIRHSLGDVVELGGEQVPEDLHWQAYPVPLEQTGIPHLLEIRYPSDIEQSLGVSVIEANAAGAVVPVGLDSGVEVRATAPGEPPEWRTQRILFWPKTRSPLVFVSSRDPGRSAVFGRIRVLASDSTMARTVLPLADRATRTIGPYFGRPMFAENFSAPESLDAWSGRTLDDWSTFYRGGQRLVSYLDYAGYNGAMIAVAVDGSAIYPSTLLRPTPRYDTGVFFSNGQDLERKDAVELLMQMFDRNHMHFLPVLHFASPLPELEALVHRHGAEATGLTWINADGKRWTQVHGTHQGNAAYYNVLDPRVQGAIRNVVQEFVDRYAHHRSLSGVAVALSTVGYAQLPGPEWGFDDVTIERFEQDTGIDVPGNGARRFAQRSEFLLGNERETWLRWRAQVVADFHRSLVSVLPGDATLHIISAELFDSQERKQQLRPRLPSELSVETVFYEAGIDASNYVDEPRIVISRPSRFTSPNTVAAHAIHAQVNRSRTFDRLLSGGSQQGSHFYHDPTQRRVHSFDSRSPFSETYTWLVPHVSLSGIRNRERFAHSLASLDSQWVFDGGWMALLGGEDDLRPMATTIAQLPNVRFTTVSLETDPVTMRTAVVDGKTFVYLVNDSQWSVSTELQLRASLDGSASALGTSSMPPPDIRNGQGVWNHVLAPYDVIAFSHSATDLEIVDAEVRVTGNVERTLESRILDLDARLTSLVSPAKYDAIPNPDFEANVPGDATVTGWQVRPATSGSVSVVTNDPHQGQRAAQLSSTGAIQLVSDTFVPPDTGRLSVWVWLRLPSGARQPPLRLAVEGTLNGEPYYRFAQVGDGRAGLEIDDEWTPFQFLIDDLPFSGLSDLRVRFELLEAGTVDIDSVRLSHLAFSQPEIKELKKIVSNANVKLVTGQLGQCARILNDYWPQYLAEHVTMPNSQMTRQATDPAVADQFPADAAQGDGRNAVDATTGANATEEDRSPGLVERIRRFLPRFQ